MPAVHPHIHTSHLRGCLNSQVTWSCLAEADSNAKPTRCCKINEVLLCSKLETASNCVGIVHAQYVITTALPMDDECAKLTFSHDLPF